MIQEIKLQVETSKRTIRVPATVEYDRGRIWFLKSPFALKDEIKAMQGSKWHGFDDEPRKIWSIEDSQRNRFQLQFLQGEDVYAWFDRDLEKHPSRHPLMDHQHDLANAGCTYHYHIFAAEMGTGKTLSAQCVIEEAVKAIHNATHESWWWVGPKSSLPNMRREFKKWDFDPTGIVEFMTYDELVKRMDNFKPGDYFPQGVIGDESSKLKNAAAQRTKAFQMLADMIREKYGMEGYVILMSGTPSPKSPVDWWAQCEIVWPGFLKEGSPKALQSRLAILEQQSVAGTTFNKHVSWRDDPRKCDKCGRFEEEHIAWDPDEVRPLDYHAFVPSKNEVAYLYERLKGLVTVEHQKDCLSLPDKRYRVIRCKPSPSVNRVAKALADSAPNTITGITWLRELSDGFQYKEVTDGKSKCNHCENGKIGEWYDPEDPQRSFRSTDMLEEALVNRLEKHELNCPQCHGSGEMPRKVRVCREVPCPKDNAIRELLEECEETGRIVMFAAFTGSIDRAVKLCHKEGWSVVRLDGRGYETTDYQGKVVTGEALDYWSDRSNPRVAFIAHPESGGMSLTLTESRMAVFISNTNKPENRIQAEARVHRKGMDENLGCTIVDIFHLPTDERILDLVRDNRRLELMTMGEITQSINWEATDE